MNVSGDVSVNTTHFIIDTSLMSSARGIATASPSSELDVNGQIKADSLNVSGFLTAHSLHITGTITGALLVLTVWILVGVNSGNC